jgi:hypothetical protein
MDLGRVLTLFRYSFWRQSPERRATHSESSCARLGLRRAVFDELIGLLSFLSVLPLKKIEIYVSHCTEGVFQRHQNQTGSARKQRGTYS